MNARTTLFTDIGSFFTQSDWFPMVKLPFWVLLFTVAAGGVYCARYGKKTLFNLGIGGALNLTFLYLVAAIACIYMPFLRDLATELPFLSVSDHGISLVDPFALHLRNLAPPLLRLMILIFLVNLADSLRSVGRTLPGWLLSQLAAAAIALLMYTILITGLSLILPALLGRYAFIPVIVLIFIGILMLCGKFVFTMIFRNGNSVFSAVCKFFTINRVGSLLTTSAIGLLLSLAVLCVLRVRGNAVLVYAGANSIGLWIILAMLLAVAYIFCMFYSDRKKN